MNNHLALVSYVMIFLFLFLLGNIHSSTTLTFKLHSLFYSSAPHFKRCKIGFFFQFYFIQFSCFKLHTSSAFYSIMFQFYFLRMPCATLMRSYIIPFFVLKIGGGLSPSCMAIDTRRWDNFRRKWSAPRFKLIYGRNMQQTMQAMLFLFKTHGHFLSQRHDGCIKCTKGTTTTTWKIQSSTEYGIVKNFYF